MRQSSYRALALTITVLLHFASGAFGQTARPVPENAQASRYGSGWECNRGFRRQDDACFEVKLPDNAFLTHSSYGKGWDCHYGFLEKGDQCLTVQIPANAYLDRIPATAGDARVDTAKAMWAATLLKSRRTRSCRITPKDPVGNAKEVIAQRNRHASSSKSLPMPI
jgi:hypothetical protein